MSTLCQKLGGEAAIQAVVDKFYEQMMIDPKVNYFFKTTDMKKQRRQQRGVNKYEGKNMKDAHKNMPIGQLQFDITWNHLLNALKHFKVNDDLIGQVKNIFYSVKGDVISKK